LRNFCLNNKYYNNNFLIKKNIVRINESKLINKNKAKENTTTIIKLQTHLNEAKPISPITLMPP